MSEAPRPEGERVEAVPTTSTRAGLLRRLIVFQIKLALDGLRDLVLSPLALLAVLIGVVFGGDVPDRPFRRLLAFGRRTDRWIDLFEVHRSGPAPSHEPAPAATAADLIDTAERLVREEVAHGAGRAELLRRLAGLRRSPSPGPAPESSNDSGKSAQGIGEKGEFPQ